jgi:hypothetical protein
MSLSSKIKKPSASTSSKSSSSWTRDSDVQKLQSVFPSRPLRTIESTYEAFNGNLDDCIDFLLSSGIDNEPTPPLNTIQSSSSMKCTSRNTTLSSKSQPLSDYQAFTDWKQNFESLLSKEDLSQIWKDVRKDYWNEGWDISKLAEIAAVIAQQKIAEKFDDPQPLTTSSGMSNNLISTATTANTHCLKGVSISLLTESESSKNLSFQSYCQLFEGLLSRDKLKDIWNGISERDLTLQEKEELAVLYAMEWLDDHQSNNHDDNDVEALSLMELLATSEAQRLEKQQNMHWAKQAKLQKTQTTQEAVLQTVFDIFEDSISQTVLTKQHIAEVLLQCEYDVEEAVNGLCVDILKAGSFVDPQLSFAEVTTAPSKRKIIKKKQKQEISKVHRDSEEKSNILYRLQSDGYQFRFGEHFAKVLKSKNPLVRVVVDENGALVYTGMKSNQIQRRLDNINNENVLLIQVDLHGLPVVQALQVVDSSIDYYREVFDRKKVNIKHVNLRFVVGKGLHSPGGIPKIGPAVLKLLKDRQESNFVHYDGEIRFNI